MSEWIPVGERLPDKEDKYLVTICVHGVYEVRESWFLIYGTVTSWVERNTIAWMPLPEPYKAESEDTEC